LNGRDRGRLVCLVGSEDEFDRLVRVASPALLRAAWLLVGDWPAAEDLVQGAFERTWPRWSKLADDDQRRAYLHRVLTNLFLRGRRRRWIGELATGDLPQPPGVEEADALALRTSVLAAVRRLPPRQRAVIALRYLADLSESQTAAALGCSVGTVKGYAARALAALRVAPAVLDLLAEETRP
jgi:RNA polymerase sigma-70 factor (sigma-E family)